MEAIRKKMSNMKNEIAEKDAENAKLKSELRKLREQIDNEGINDQSKLRRIASQEREIEELENRIAKLNTVANDTNDTATNQIYDRKIAMLETDYKSAQRRLEEMGEKYKEALDQAENAEREIKRLQWENETLEMDLEVAQDKYQKIKQEMEKTLMELADI